VHIWTHRPFHSTIVPHSIDASMTYYSVWSRRSRLDLRSIALAWCVLFRDGECTRQRALLYMDEMLYLYISMSNTMPNAGYCFQKQKHNSDPSFQTIVTLLPHDPLPQNLFSSKNFSTSSFLCPLTMICCVNWLIITSFSSTFSALCKSVLNTLIFPSIRLILVCFKFPPLFDSKYTGRLFVPVRVIRYGFAGSVEDVDEGEGAEEMETVEAHLRPSNCLNVDGRGRASGRRKVRDIEVE